MDINCLLANAERWSFLIVLVDRGGASGIERALLSPPGGRRADGRSTCSDRNRPHLVSLRLARKAMSKIGAWDPPYVWMEGSVGESPNSCAEIGLLIVGKGRPCLGIGGLEGRSVGRDHLGTLDAGPEEPEEDRQADEHLAPVLPDQAPEIAGTPLAGQDLVAHASDFSCGWKRLGEPDPGTCRFQLWLLPSGPDQVHQAAMRGGPPHSLYAIIMAILFPDEMRSIDS